MLKESVTIEDVIALLNDACEKDLDAMDALAKARVACNDALAAHPTIQVGKLGGDEYKVGIIGILNGIFGTADDGYGAIAGTFDILCPNGHELPEKFSTIDKCPECGSLVASKLTGFLRIR